ncbi:glycosyltransferase [Streptomyces sp. NPDC093094]|uniref:glycosyltransferase n=1 Tax=Streptomyces sp. NPDC093094 TaxID=3366026 RepID=UPI0037FB8DFC
MSRFLFVVPPFVGHLNPLLAVAAELTARGHQVAWAGNEPWLRSRIRSGARVYDVITADFVRRADDRPAELRGAAALKYLWQDYLVPLAEATTGAVGRAVAEFRPDVLVADQQAFAGALVAERTGIPLATTASTSAEIVSPLAPKVAEWVRGLLHGLRARFGDPAATTDLRFAGDPVLVFTTRALTGPVDTTGRPIHFVGPAIGGRPAAEWSWPWGTSDAAVLVTLGTANIDVGEPFLARAAEFFAGRPDLPAIIVDPAGDLGPQPDTIAVVPNVPVLSVLPRCAAVVCHAGQNTVCEALWHGVPLVVAPIRDDQQLIAGQVVAAGAGVRIRFGRSDATRIGQAVDTVLGDQGFRTAATAVGDSFRAAGGVTAAAERLHRLALGTGGHRIEESARPAG